jgi:hypothetical protein
MHPTRYSMMQKEKLLLLQLVFLLVVAILMVSKYLQVPDIRSDTFNA